MTDLRQIFQEQRARRPSVVAKAAPKQVERERLFAVLRRAIVDGQIAPGTRLTEREMCEAFDVSRTVVREVIRMIAAEKLGDFEPHVGLRVAELSRKRVQEIYQIRTELETIVVRGFVAAASDDEIAVAQDYTRRMLEFAAEGDRIASVETMAEFERFMARVADNEVAAEVLGQLSTRVSMLRLVAMRELGQIETNMAGLRAILAGIVARDADAAVQAVRTFVSHSGQSVLRYMDRIAATTELDTTTPIADKTEEDTAL